MVLLDQRISQSQRHPWWKYGAWALLVLGLLVVSLYMVVFVRVVPPISATLVDAVSGKPVAGMNLCLQVSFHAWEMREVGAASSPTATAPGEFSSRLLSIPWVYCRAGRDTPFG
jgi:hypothetical protein